MNAQVMEMIAEAARLKSTELDLSGQGLTELPQGIKFLTELQDLDLFNNQLSILSDEIGSLTNLKVLNLSDNQLSILPDAIATRCCCRPES